MSVEAKLGDFITLQRGKTYKSKLLNSPGPYLLGLASIARNGGFRTDNLKTYGGDSPEALLLRPGDLFVSLKDVTQSADLLGAIARVPESIPLGRLTQDTVKLQFLEGAPDPSYIYWLLQTPQYRAYCRNHATGTTNLGLSREDFLAFPVPEINRTRELIFTSLDNIERKIEHNRRTAQKLEELAHAIFRAWFIDFEPVKAKAAGRKSFPSMPQPVFDALPTSFTDTELGPVPEGWEVKPLASVATFLNGLALQKFPPRGDGTDLPVIKIAQLRKGSTEGAGLANSDIDEKYVIDDRDLVFSWSGTLEAEFWFGGKGALNQHLFKVTSEDFPSWLCLLWIRQHLPWFRQIASSKATTMGHIKREHLKEAKVIVPQESVLVEADKTIGTLYDLHAQANIESRKLARMRDYLLPKLLSGEVRVAVDDAASEAQE